MDKHEEYRPKVGLNGTDLDQGNANLKKCTVVTTKILEVNRC